MTLTHVRLGCLVHHINAFISCYFLRSNDSLLVFFPTALQLHLKSRICPQPLTIPPKQDRYRHHRKGDEP